MSSLQNGELIAAAGSAGFDVLVMTDRNLKYQQNLTVTARTFSIVVLLTTSWPRIQGSLHAVVQAVDAATPGAYVEVTPVTELGEL